MSIKLLALDVDGTLTQDNGSISEENILAVKRVVKNGVKVVLATGRHREGVERILQKLGLKEDTPLILTNGSLILKGDEVLLKECMTPTEITGVITYGQKLGNVVITVFLPDEVQYWVPPIFEEDLIEEILYSFDIFTKKRVEDPQKLARNNVTKMMFIAKNHETASKAIANWPDRLSYLKVGHSLDYLCEINNPAVDKGKALEIVCRYLGISLSNVLAIGDGQNDVPMLERVKYGVFVKKSEVRTNLPENVELVPEAYKNKAVAWATKKYDLIGEF